MQPAMLWLKGALQVVGLLRKERVLSQLAHNEGRCGPRGEGGGYLAARSSMACTILRDGIESDIHSHPMGFVGPGSAMKLRRDRRTIAIQMNRRNRQIAQEQSLQQKNAGQLLRSKAPTGG